MSDVIQKSDILVCIPGFHDNFKDKDRYAGEGYEEGLINEVSYIDEENKIYGKFKDGNGVYLKALRKADLFEIRFFNAGVKNINNMYLSEGEIAICVPELDCGSAGFKKGLLFKIHNSNTKKDPNFIHWVKENGIKGHGVFAKEIRRANQEEEKYYYSEFKKGIKELIKYEPIGFDLATAIEIELSTAVGNYIQIEIEKNKVKKEYLISYISENDEIKKIQITASDEDSAISKIKDLKHLNYIMGG